MTALTVALCSAKLSLTRLSLLAIVLTALLTPSHPASAVNIDWVTVGDPGNACDTQPPRGEILGGCFGSVSYDHRISKYETTNGQYADFLNAVASTDTNALYSPFMDSGFAGGITRSGGTGNYSYSAIAGRELWPVNFVSFYDSLRFANWLHNGQPTGAQDSTTTEDGAYTITPAGIAGNAIARNAVATIFLTSEDEWFKAAYYDSVSMSFFDYPAGSDVQITCAAPGGTANTANCLSAAASLSDVGSYTGSSSPYGTFDQGGNVFEWNEAMIAGFTDEGEAVSRGLRGGSSGNVPNDLAASIRDATNPVAMQGDWGFRVASIVPEPGTAVLMGLGLLGLGARRGR